MRITFLYGYNKETHDDIKNLTNTGKKWNLKLNEDDTENIIRMAVVLVIIL